MHLDKWKKKAFCIHAFKPQIFLEKSSKKVGELMFFLLSNPKTPKKILQKFLEKKLTEQSN